MKKLFIVFICFTAILLQSCSFQKSDGSDFSPQNEGKVHVPTPSDYASEDISYTAKISDGIRTVSFNAERKNGVTVAEITSPEELAGTRFTDDIDGVRVFLASDGSELNISPQAAAGLCVIFDSLAHVPSSAEYSPSVGKFNFEQGEYDVSLSLDSEGMPLVVEIFDGTYKRCAEIAVK